MNVELLEELVNSESKKIDFIISKKSCKLICEFLIILSRWNKIHNLTSMKNEKTLVEEHIVDSWMALTPLKKISKNKQNKVNIIADIGSGNGVPGIIWSITDPELNIVLVEKTAKKIAFLNHVIGLLKLSKKVSTIKDDVRNIRANQFDVITSRAFANCENFLEATKSISKKDTFWLMMTTKSRSSKLTEKILNKLNVKVISQTSVTINKKRTEKQIICLQSVFD